MRVGGAKCKGSDLSGVYPHQVLFALDLIMMILSWLLASVPANCHYLAFVIAFRW